MRADAGKACSLLRRSTSWHEPGMLYPQHRFELRIVDTRGCDVAGEQSGPTNRSVCRALETLGPLALKGTIENNLWTTMLCVRMVVPSMPWGVEKAGRSTWPTAPASLVCRACVTDASGTAGWVATAAQP